MLNYVDITQAPYNVTPATSLEGAEDVSATIQDAIDDATGSNEPRTIWFPPGYYGLANTLTIGTGTFVNLQGAGSGAIATERGSVIVGVSGGDVDPMVLLRHRDVSISGLVLRGLSSGIGIHLDGPNSTGNGLTNIRLADLICENLSKAFVADCVYQSVAERVRSNCSIELKGGSTSIALIACYISDLSTTSGFLIDTCHYVSLVSCACDSAETNRAEFGYKLYGTSSGITLVSCGAEQCGYGHTQVGADVQCVSLEACFGDSNGYSLDGSTHVASAVEAAGGRIQVSQFMDINSQGGTNRLANVHAKSTSYDVSVIGGRLDKGVKKDSGCVQLFTLGVPIVGSGWTSHLMYYDGDVRISGTLTQNS